MGTPNTNFERRVEKALKESAKNNKRSLQAEINEQVANSLKVPTYENILRKVENNFNLFLKQNNKTNMNLDVYSDDSGRIELYSDHFSFGVTQKKACIRVALSDNVAIAYLRFNSTDGQIRSEIENVLKNNSNKWITSGYGKKHTEVGLNTRVHDEIDLMDSNLMYNILVDLFNLINQYI